MRSPITPSDRPHIRRERRKCRSTPDRTIAQTQVVSEFLERLSRAPVGLAWLATLELVATDGPQQAGRVDPLRASSPSGVERAAELAAALPLGELLRIAVLSTDSISPWYDSTRPEPVFEFAGHRTPILDAIAQRPDLDQLELPATSTQWFWNDGDWLDTAISQDLGLNTMPNWFPHIGTLSTSSPFPDDSEWPTFEAPVESEWDLCFGPVTRWSVQTRDSARIHQIDGPEDWVELVERFPRAAELDAGVIEDLMSVGYDDAGDWHRCIGVDWPKVTEVYDGVHLSWAGFLTVNALPISLGDHDMTLMRRWGAERTAWLTPTLEDPEPLPVEPDKLRSAVEPTDPRWDVERAQWRARLG